MKQLFQILLKHKLLISFRIVVFIIMFLSYVRISIGNLVSHNAIDVSMLGPEMLCESGSDFEKAAEDNTKMLKAYTNHMEDKYLGDILRVFYDEYSLTKGFEKALKTLEKAKNSSQEEYTRTIWLASEQIEKYRMKASTFSNFFPLVTQTDRF